MASLFVVRGRDQGKHFELRNTAQRIGRDGSSEIQLLDSEVSRNHAQIACDQATGTYQLADLDSSNGTIVNGNAVSNITLKSGDRIEVGGTLMIFTGVGQAASLDHAHGVDIVRQSRDEDASQIVSSLSQSGSNSDLSNTEAQKSLDVMYLTAIAVGRGEDLDTVLDRILKLVFDWVDADRGCVMLRDPQTEKLQPAARCDRGPVDGALEIDVDHTRRSVRPIEISYTILDYVMESKEGVRTSNAGGDDRFDSAASIVRGGVREALCVPLQGRYAVVGALYVDTYTSPGQMVRLGGQQKFNDDHLRLITAIGHQAALAIEDTFYYSALLQSERLAAMGQTIATLSHHIKNILQGIRGGSYLIDAGLKRDDNEAIRRGWGIVERNQERISNLVLDMLSFSKERQPEKVEADLNETVRDVVELMQIRAADLNVVLGEDYDANMPLAEFDPDAIHRAVLNLVTNAIDAVAAHHQRRSSDQSGNDETIDLQWDDVDDELSASTAFTVETSPPVQGRVFVQTKFSETDGWLVDVVDNGPGIPEQQRDKLFSLFESTKGHAGTGLGLPVSAKILREHGGDIRLLNPARGQGSCFRIRLPRSGTRASEIAIQDTML